MFAIVLIRYWGIIMKKKFHSKFNIPNFGTKSRKGVKDRWRKQTGKDNKKRKKLAHAGAEPTIGYRNMEGVRGLKRNGRLAVLVSNEKEFRDAVVSGNGNIEITFAKAMGYRKREMLAKRAIEKKIRITNFNEREKKKVGDE
ncbi:60S ribosomal protein L32, partial [mine drainage metagenome]